MKTINCDVVVVGAGPGGSMAAKTCAKFGLDTVLVERKEYPEHSRSNMSTLIDRRILDYVKIDESIIRSKVWAIKQYFPDGTEISTREPEGYEIAYVMNRKVFDKRVLELALKEGAKFMNKTRVMGLLKEEEKVKGVKAKIDEKEDVEIRSDIVIGADGVESNVGSWAGIYKKSLKDDDAIVMLECVLDGVVGVERGCYYQYAGWKDASDILFTLCPGSDLGKVGLTVMPLSLFHPTRKGQLLDGQRYLIKNHPFFKKAKIVERGGGVMPQVPLKKFTTDNVMLVGDAAYQPTKTHSAGCLRAMDAGVLAGEVAVEAHEEGDFSSELLSRYEKRWYRLHGERDFLDYSIRRFTQKMPHEYFDIAGHTLKEDDARLDRLFEELGKSPKIGSKIVHELKEEGLDISDMLSFASLSKKYYINYWDTFIQ